jgi:cell division protein FtsZ
MGDFVSPQAGIHQAFAMADTTISQSIRSIVNLIQRPGLIHIGFDDLLAALRMRNGRCLFGYGESDSDNRAHDALTQALKNPLMDRGRMLADATNILVHVAGGPGMTLSEVEVLMQELGRHVNEQTQILFGAVVDSRLGSRLTVTVISSLAADEEIVSLASSAATPSIVSAAADPVREESHRPPPQIYIEPEPMEPAPPVETVDIEQPFNDDITPAAESVPLEPEPITHAPATIHVMPKKPTQNEGTLPPEKPVQAKQETLQFEPVTRGRFEKSEPTIVEGEDLDVPTYLRKNIKVK